MKLTYLRSHLVRRLLYTILGRPWDRISLYAQQTKDFILCWILNVISFFFSLWSLKHLFFSEYFSFTCLNLVLVFYSFFFSLCFNCIFFYLVTMSKTDLFFLVFTERTLSGALDNNKTFQKKYYSVNECFLAGRRVQYFDQILPSQP